MMISEQQAKAFASDPPEYFHNSFTEMHSLSPAERDELQLAALQYRFSDLRDAVPTLKKIADKQNIHRLDVLEDVLPLLFDHTMFKSYPVSFLDDNRFDLLTRWLGKLTRHDLSGLDASECKGITDWMLLLEALTPIKIAHSAGTSGTMSFIPISSDEWTVFGKMNTLGYFQKYGDRAPKELKVPGIHAVFPGYRSGGNGFLRQNDGTVQYITGSEERLYTLYPGFQDSDVLYLAARIRAAKAKGLLDEIKIPPNLQAKQKAFEATQAGSPRRLDAFFDSISRDLADKRIFLLAPWSILYDMAVAGFKKGLHHVFAPNSVIFSGGGTKGVEPPANWQEEVLKFCGVEKLGMVYGMMEMCTANPMCDHSYYHLMPSIIPFILDPDTSKALPRTGTVTGRFAFVDLLASSRWSGFITGDEVTMRWDGDCPCGAKSPRIEKNIVRYSERRGGDDKINCASTPEAHQEAMDFLKGRVNALE